MNRSELKVSINKFFLNIELHNDASRDIRNIRKFGNN